MSVFTKIYMEVKVKKADGKSVLVLLEDSQEHVIAESEGSVTRTFSPKKKRIVALLTPELKAVLYYIPEHKKVLEVELKGTKSLEFARDEKEERLALAVSYGNRRAKLYVVEGSKVSEEKEYDSRISISREGDELVVEEYSERSPFFTLCPIDDHEQEDRQGV